MARRDDPRKPTDRVADEVLGLLMSDVQGPAASAGWEEVEQGPDHSNRQLVDPAMLRRRARPDERPVDPGGPSGLVGALASPGRLVGTVVRAIPGPIRFVLGGVLLFAVFFGVGLPLLWLFVDGVAMPRIIPDSWKTHWVGADE